MPVRSVASGRFTPMKQTKPTLRTIFGEPSWRLTSDRVELYVTRIGGHLGPVTFDKQKRKLQPYSIAPWATESQTRKDPNLPPLMRAMRGDFFCMPFGGNATMWRGEKHPTHGETANAPWSVLGLARDRDAGTSTLRLALETSIRSGRVLKEITLQDGHDAVYSRHTISQMHGPMTMGHHAMLHFKPEYGPGEISTSRIVLGQVYIEPLERPEDRGYSILKPGAKFKTLKSVPTILGDRADLSIYPQRRGFEDLLMMASDASQPLAWTAVTFPKTRWAWLAIKNPQVLASTVLWFSNGGRHYAPWSGRHVNVLGLEEVTSWFHPGLAQSVRPNSWSAAGIPTHLKLQSDKPLAVNYITTAFSIPAGFDAVARISPEDNGDWVRIISRSGGSVRIRLNLGHLN